MKRLSTTNALAALLLIVGLLAFPTIGMAESSSATTTASSTSAVSASSASAKAIEVADDPFKGAAPVSLADGVYLVEVSLEGGSGKATIASPTEFEVFGGVAAMKVEWSSSNYDYMIVGGWKYLPVNEGGNSTFVIPVLAYDKPFDVVGDTTAMSEAHEIDYRIRIALDTVQPFVENETAVEGGLSVSWIVFIVCAALSATILAAIIVLIVRYRRKTRLSG